jgi:hypothetical protein
MKTKQNKEFLENTKTNKTILKHILSPLELCAWDNEYKAFTYQLDTISIHVSAKDSMQIMANSKAKLDTFSLLIFKTRGKLTEGKEETTKDFLDSDITTHQLPSYILNIICYRYQCKTPYDVLMLGKPKLKTSKGIGSVAIKNLETLFKKHKCNHLF